ncbi:ABC transporter substrate-binding protein [Nonomuraea lactucae]|uniref:ABC transporter substrate-binding protein n=1 Tax=Nonomuraea lactucae TaxID=2249762 RepID=UPI0013B46E73|nr:ABC transporter substrate-binding protein [Nonomuraea lactucae]
MLGLALASSLASCGSDGSTAAATTFRWGYPSRATTLDPHKAGQFDLIFQMPVYDTLIKNDPESGAFVPGLATEWKLAPDGKTLDLTLRQGVKFQDGATFDAEAVRASLERGKRPEMNAASDLEAIDRIEVVDPSHVRLHLSRPGGHLLSVLTNEGGMIISPKALNDPDLAHKPVGAGPYKVTAYSTREVAYETWDGYWNRPSVTMPRVKMITMSDDSTRLRALESHQLDAAYLRPAQTPRLKSAGLNVLIKPRTLVYTVLLNTSRPGLKDGEVRKALSQAIDRDGIDKNLAKDGCQPTVQPFIEAYSPHVPGLEARPDAAYDPARAKESLAKAGYTDAKPLSFTITAPNITQYQVLAEALQAQFGKAGVKTELQVVDAAQVNPMMRSGKFDALVIPIDVGRPDPTTFVADHYLKNGPINPGKFHLPGLDELVDRARRESSPEGQQGPMRELFQKVFEAGPPVIPICAPDNVVGVQPGVTGISIPQMGTFAFHGVRIGKKG